MASPLFENVYLHYVFDLWANRWRRREAKGNVIILRYADDIVVGFEHEVDARRFWDAMRSRLEEFSLELRPDKTRLLEFGRYAAVNRQSRGSWPTEDLHLSGFHLYLRQVSSRGFPVTAEDPRGSHAGETQADQGGATEAHARTDSSARAMAQAGGSRILRVSRCAYQRAGTRRIPTLRH
ncbi:reverse transcriptase domain-containing protein [Paraburkholderia sediminicola]|uniref:reverse transcriptase domain-containing protein n=1 Tax=Paraburkholderia sediminicola TaxID=458836 RepID=UPI0038BB2674